MDRRMMDHGSNLTGLPIGHRQGLPRAVSPLNSTIRADNTSGGNHAKVVTIADDVVITVQSKGNTWRNDNFTADHFSHDIAQLKSKMKMAEQQQAAAAVCLRHIPNLPVTSQKEDEKLPVAGRKKPEKTFRAGVR
ncbi:hypothetical protein MTO96_031041 [Rhipicephalus appendiculatus]